MEYKRLTNRTPDGIAYTEIPLNESHIMEKQCFTGFVADRLVAYEDSGLSPEEVQEIARAKAEGRLVVLPVKMGDMVYAIDHPTLSAINPVPVLTDWEIAEKPFAIEDLSKVGKTVFLTREEAEKSIGSDTQGL